MTFQSIAALLSVIHLRKEKKKKWRSFQRIDEGLIAQAETSPRNLLAAVNGWVSRWGCHSVPCFLVTFSE